MPPTPLSLLELNNTIKEVVDNNFAGSYWVTGEISELKINPTGHCYIELIQKAEMNDRIVARSRATIWVNTFRMIKPYFETTTNQSLSIGMGIMVKVSVEFHEVYGLSLNITDIEPAYTVGELALRKQKIVQQLDEEGVLHMNKELELPFLCQKIAVISSLTAAGYEDFHDQLVNNPFHFKFYLKLFPAIMQGEDAEKSIIEALEKVYHYESLFDAVVIIRGGGSKADLSCFDSYWLAYHITQFTLPVLTGIGHEQDDSVADLVAHSRFKTPTAVAAFLVDLFAGRYSELNRLQEEITSKSKELMSDSKDVIETKISIFTSKIKELVQKRKSNLQNFNYLLVSSVRKLVHRKEMLLNKKEINLRLSSGKFKEYPQNMLENYTGNFIKQLNFTFANNLNKLDRMHDKIIYLNPEKILKRGYSITMKNGTVLKSTKTIEEGDQLVTILYKGKLISVLKKKSL
ncbi:MAG: exodeoxyribonuclease VII large subunit [Bacteroidales bacterium]|nr:exodeoxyribonuclease VII large subunit [Bacteroidales bacterium]